MKTTSIESGAASKAAGRRKATAKVAAPLDLVKAHPEIFSAKAAPVVVSLGARSAVAIDGQGDPGGPAFQAAIGALYGVVYTLKFARKGTARTEFKVGPLESRWWTDRPELPLAEVPPGQWRWRIRVMVPDDVDPDELAEVVIGATTKKGGRLEGSEQALRAFVERLAPGRALRFLHVGPYATEPMSFELMQAFLAREGLAATHGFSEIYLSDPRRVSPEKNKTVLLLDLRE